MSDEARTVTFGDVQIYQSSWEIVATKGEDSKVASVWLNPIFQCPDGCELNARDLPLTCEHGWSIKEDPRAYDDE